LAFAATRALNDFVEQRLVSCLRRYPKTGLTKLGTRRLEALGVSSNRIAELQRELAPALREFWQAVGAPVDIRTPD